MKVFLKVSLIVILILALLVLAGFLVIDGAIEISTDGVTMNVWLV